MASYRALMQIFAKVLNTPKLLLILPTRTLPTCVSRKASLTTFVVTHA